MRNLGFAKALLAMAVLATGASYAVPSRPAADEAASAPPILFSAPGRIEGASETIDVGAGTDGVIATVLVGEGDVVSRGQLLATLDCEDRKRRVGATAAHAEAVAHRRRRLLRGGTPDEVAVSEAEVGAAAARLTRIETEMRRASELWDQQIIPKSVFDQAVKAKEEAYAEWQAAMHRVQVAKAEPLEEDIAAFDAELAEASAAVAHAKDSLAQCDVTSPISGIVVRQHKHPGETFAILAGAPIVSVADVSSFRVRAEVDEADIGRVRDRGVAYVTAGAFGERHLPARVILVSQQMGRKHTFTGAPAEKVDRDVLDVICQIDPTDVKLVVGLRVTVVFAVPGG